MRRKIIYNLVSGDLYFVLKPDCISIKNGVKKKVSAATVENQLVGPICLSYNKIKNELEPTSMENLLLGIAYHELMHKVSYKDDTRKIPHHVQTFVDSHLTLFEPTQESVLTFSQFFFPWVEKYEILVKRAIKNDKK